MRSEYQATCRCGEVELTMRGPVIAHLACYCDDCQAGAAMVDALPDGSGGLAEDGATHGVLFRKDRVALTRGARLLEARRLRPSSPAARLVTTCCKTAMGLVFTNWLPQAAVRADLVEPAPPPLELRIQTRFAPDEARVAKDVPTARGVPMRLVLRFLRARAAWPIPVGIDFAG